MKYTTIAVVLLLAACGADGSPNAPEHKQQGMNVSGEVTIGVQTEL